MQDRVNKLVILDAGHGGTDPGTVNGDIKEKDYNLKISKYISDRLNTLGISNKLVRSTDETLSPTDRINRIKSLYSPGEDVLIISNHLNSGGGDGAEVIYALRNNDNFSKVIVDNMLKVGQNVRKYYQRRLPSNPNKDYYFIIRDTDPKETILMEYAFVDSPGDDINQIKNGYELLAEAMVKSIAEYLNVPYTPIQTNSNIYVVKKGDTLYSIARKFNISVDKLKDINNLKSNLISIGQNLIISDDNTSNVIPLSNDVVYTVKKGDTLWSIAKQYNTTVDKIKSLNNLSSNTLQINQKLIVGTDASSSSESNVITYTVVKGDTLYSISRRFNTTVTDIIKLNDLKTTTLSIGQKLLIEKK
ncbi:MAG: LysM peptidoglycan-binding domain-containing protein [Bacilli bacterium]|nr:LysM peptidoglycan-binding domain-containing protein [Bacilli bacterium]